MDDNKYPKTRCLPGETIPGHLAKIYDYLEQKIKTDQRPPSNREMLEAGFASSTSVIRHYYHLMQRLGMIHLDYAVARGVRIVPRKQWAKYAEEGFAPRAVNFRDVSEPAEEVEQEVQNVTQR
jgi:SOS-response transcriptional repressor LexA